VKTLVTGASGRIGRQVALGLKKAKHDVVGLCRHGADVDDLLHSGVEIVFGDTSVEATVQGCLDGCSTVVHAGCVRSAARQSTYQHFNTQGTIRLAEEAARLGTERLIFISSIVAQGPSGPDTPHRSPGGEQPTTPYGRSLLACETVLKAGILADRVTILRPGLVYGVQPSPLRKWIKGVSLGVVPSRPGMSLSFLHIQDLVDTVRGLTERAEPCPGTYFLSDGLPVTHEQLIDLIEAALGGRPAIRLPITKGLLNQVAGALNHLRDASGLFAEQAQFTQHFAGQSWSCLSDDAVAAFGFQAQRHLVSELSGIVARQV